MGILKTTAMLLPFLLILLSQSCAQDTPVSQSAPLPERTKQEQQTFSARFEDIDSGLRSVPEDAKPLVLFFAADTCLICAQETEHLVQTFKGQGGTPKNVNFYTVMIGAFPEDAISWREDFGVSWPVGIDEGDPLFRKYCPELKTPCVLTYNPIDKSLARFVGGSTIEELEEETGKWEY